MSEIHVGDPAPDFRLPVAGNKLDKAGVVRFREEYGTGQLPDPERLLEVVRGLTG